MVPEPKVPDAKVGDIVPISGTRHLEFAGLVPMKNRSGEVFHLGDHCRGIEHSTLEAVVGDDKRLRATYREPHERGSHSVGGLDVTAQDARDDCPDQSTVVCSHEEWRAIMREYLISDGSRANLREWILQHPPVQPAPH